MRLSIVIAYVKVCLSPSNVLFHLSRVRVLFKQYFTLRQLMLKTLYQVIRKPMWFIDYIVQCVLLSTLVRLVGF